MVAVWWVESTCDDARLGREVMLACDAVDGTCRVAAHKSDAELVAHLACSSDDESWVLETRTIDGRLLGRLVLRGSDEDRLREAAIEVAREPGPERVTPTADPDVPARDAAKTTEQTHEPRAHLALSALALDAVQTGLGGRLALGVRVPGADDVHGLFAAAAAKPAEGTDIFHFAVGAGYGAPFTPKRVLGASIEAGLQTHRALRTTNYGVAQATAYVALPWRDVRPFVALGAGALFGADYGGQPFAHLTTSLQVGFGL